MKEYKGEYGHAMHESPQFGEIFFLTMIMSHGWVSVPRV